MSEATLKAATLAKLNGGAAWCKKANAVNAAGKPVPALSPTAVKWDVVGALMKAQDQSIEPDWKSYHAVYVTLRNKIPGTYMSEDLEAYNDDATWAQIAALFV